MSSAAGRWPRRAANRSARRPTARARRSSTCSPTAFRTSSKARGCSTFLPEPARWGSRRCRGARALPVHRGMAEGRGLIRTNVEASACRRTIFRRDAPGWAMSARSRRSAWSSPIRPMARGLARWRFARRSRAAGCCPARFAWSRRPSSGAFAPGEGFAVVDERGYGDTVIRFIEATGALSRRTPFRVDAPACRAAPNSASFARQMTNN